MLSLTLDTWPNRMQVRNSRFGDLVVLPGVGEARSQRRSSRQFPRSLPTSCWPDAQMLFYCMEGPLDLDPTLAMPFWCIVNFSTDQGTGAHWCLDKSVRGYIQYGARHIFCLKPTSPTLEPWRIRGPMGIQASGLTSAGLSTKLHWSQAKATCYEWLNRRRQAKVA